MYGFLVSRFCNICNIVCIWHSSSQDIADASIALRLLRASFGVFIFHLSSCYSTSLYALRARIPCETQSGLKKIAEEQFPYTANDGDDDIEQQENNTCNQDKNNGCKHNKLLFEFTLKIGYTPLLQFHIREGRQRTELSAKVGENVVNGVHFPTYNKRRGEN